MTISLHHADSAALSIIADMLVCDAPFEMSGTQLNNIINNHQANHLLLISSMKQIIEFTQANQNWGLCFDLVLDQKVPKKAKSYQQPNYTHSNVLYFKKKGVKSAFDRRKAQRLDSYSKEGYFSTIIQAARNTQGGQFAKSEAAIMGILSAFSITSVGDLFAGSGTVGIACLQLGLDCQLIEIDAEKYKSLTTLFKFLN